MSSHGEMTTLMPGLARSASPITWSATRGSKFAGWSLTTSTLGNFALACAIARSHSVNRSEPVGPPIAATLHLLLQLRKAWSTCALKNACRAIVTVAATPGVYSGSLHIGRSSVTTGLPVGFRKLFHMVQPGAPAVGANT